MAHTIILNVDGEKLKLTSCDYRVSRQVDATGKPVGEIVAGNIDFTADSSSKTFFWEWAIDKFAKKSGKITVSKLDDDQTMKEIEFTDAFLSEYDESGDSHGAQAMTERITISAKEIKIGGGTFKNEWPE